MVLIPNWGIQYKPLTRMAMKSAKYPKAMCWTTKATWNICV